MPYRQTETAHLKSIARSMKELLSDYDASSGAYREYQRSTLTMILRTVKWSQQVRKLKDPGRKKFHFEHFVTIKSLVDQVVRLRNKPVNDIAALLLSADIAWITKLEDKKLTKNKFCSKRPNPRAAYETCGIKFVEFDS
jgi:hypothetical protein